MALQPGAHLKHEVLSLLASCLYEIYSEVQIECLSVLHSCLTHHPDADLTKLIKALQSLYDTFTDALQATLIGESCKLLYLTKSKPLIDKVTRLFVQIISKQAKSTR